MDQAGYLSEPSYEMVVEMLTTLRESKPVPVTAIQFTGGEQRGIQPQHQAVVLAFGVIRIFERVQLLEGERPRALDEDSEHPGRRPSQTERVLGSGRGLANCKEPDQGIEFVR